MYIYMERVSAWCPQGLKKASDPLGLEIHSCKLPGVGGGVGDWNSGPLEELSMLLTADPFLHSPFYIFLCERKKKDKSKQKSDGDLNSFRKRAL